MTYLLALILVLFASVCDAATLYLDGNLSGNCTSGNYSIANRTCTGSSGNAYNTIAGALSALASQDTLYIRAGSYYASGTNSYTSGFNIANTKSGTSGTHTKISAYNSESVYIGTASNRMSFASICHAANYYPYPGTTIKANYVDLIGITIYGGLLIIGDDEPGAIIHDVLVDHCDIGGGIPYNDQAFTVNIHAAYNVTIKNSSIHNSGATDSPSGSPGIGGYNFYATTIQNNYFYDNCGPDVACKDTSGGSGTVIEISHNFFAPSSYGVNGGIHGITQDADIYRILIHNNIFYRKDDGGVNPFDLPPSIGYYEIYNNTFVECASDVQFWASTSYSNLRNNIFYHTRGSYYYDIHSGTTDSNYNMFYANGVSPSWHVGATNTNVFSTWQGAGHDAASSNGVNPNFINASGSTAADFKRSSYPNDVAAGSPYGRVCGAYVAGSEVIGIDSGGGDTTAPSVSITTLDPSTITSDALTATGTASDAVGVSSCKYRIGAAPTASIGTACTGTTSWSCSTSGYSVGANTLYVGCGDAAGNWGSDSITVNLIVLTNSGCSFSGAALGGN